MNVLHTHTEQMLPSFVILFKLVFLILHFYKQLLITDLDKFTQDSLLMCDWKPNNAYISKINFIYIYAYSTMVFNWSCKANSYCFLDHINVQIITFTSGGIVIISNASLHIVGTNHMLLRLKYFVNISNK